MICNICVLQGLRLAFRVACETNISQVVCYLLARRAASSGGSEAGMARKAASGGGAEAGVARRVASSVARRAASGGGALGQDSRAQRTGSERSK